MTPHRSACELCLRSPQPRALNRYTLAIAVGALLHSDPAAAAALRQKYEKGIAVGQAAERLAAILAGTGTGSQLARLLELTGCEHKSDCRFLQLAERWNAWGPAGCRLARSQIVDAIRVYFRAAGLPDGDAGSLVDEAIRCAEASEPSEMSGPQ